MDNDKKLVKEFREAVIRSFFSTGILIEEDLKLSDKDFFNKFLKILKSIRLV